MKFLYITIKDEKEGEKIATSLLQEKLIACANIFPAIKSIYSWQDNIESALEHVMIVKTSDALVDKVMDKTKALHSYECPCIAVIDIVKVNEDFAKWLESSVKVAY